MQVRCGAQWFTATDDRREYAVCFDTDDLIEKIGQDAVDKLDFNGKVKALNNLADAYVVAYVAKEGGIPQEFARKRLEELNNA